MLNALNGLMTKNKTKRTGRKTIRTQNSIVPMLQKTKKTVEKMMKTMQQILEMLKRTTGFKSNEILSKLKTNKMQ
jgi:hypothetical protein